MKLILSAIFALFCFNSQVICQENRIQSSAYGGQKNLNLSASSIYSFMDAMNNFDKIKPSGYAISSIKYIKSGNTFIVKVGLIKVS